MVKSADRIRHFRPQNLVGFGVGRDFFSTNPAIMAVGPSILYPGIHTKEVVKPVELTLGQDHMQVISEVLTGRSIANKGRIRRLVDADSRRLEEMTPVLKRLESAWGEYYGDGGIAYSYHADYKAEAVEKSAQRLLGGRVPVFVVEHNAMPLRDDVDILNYHMGNTYLTVRFLRPSKAVRHTIEFLQNAAAARQF